MRKLIQASLLALALTAPIYAGDMQQPLAAQGDIQNGITETALSILGVMLSLI